MVKISPEATNAFRKVTRLPNFNAKITGKKIFSLLTMKTNIFKVKLNRKKQFLPIICC
jgi:hypothetical protein